MRFEAVQGKPVEYNFPENTEEGLGTKNASEIYQMLQEKTTNAHKTTNIEAKAILLYNIFCMEKSAPAGKKGKNRESGQIVRVVGGMDLLKHLFDTRSQCGFTI